MRTVFLNSELQKNFEHEGFVRVKLLEDEAINQLREIFKKHTYFDHDQGFLHTHQLTRLWREYVHSLIAPILQPRLEAFLKNYRSCFSFFLAKKAGEESTIRLHQDMTLVEEDQFVGITAWCALNNMNPENGCFHVVKGSHHFCDNIRTPCIEWPFDDIKNEIEQEYLTPILMNAGEAVIFDQRLWHYSPSNCSAYDRLTAATIAIPNEANFIHYEYDEQKGIVVKYNAGKNFPIEYGVDEPLPTRCEKQTEFYYASPKINFNDFKRMYKEKNSSNRTKQNGLTGLWNLFKKRYFSA